MASRNWTLIFRKYMDALKSVRVPSLFGGGGGGRVGPVIEMASASASLLHPNSRSDAPLSTSDDPSPSSCQTWFSCFSKGVITVGLPPAWVDVSKEIAANVQRARTKMIELGKVHAKALMPSFGDGKEDQHIIETSTFEIIDLLRKSEKNLQRLSSVGPSEDSNVTKNVQSRNLSMELRKKQSTYLKCLRQQKEAFNELQVAKFEKSEAFTAETEREIQQVAESVNELAKIMKYLSVLVIDQGKVVDRIIYNIQNVATTVEEGLKELEKAERTQKQGGMVMCATVLVIMCFIMLILLILKTILF